MTKENLALLDEDTLAKKNTLILAAQNSYDIFLGYGFPGIQTVAYYTGRVVAVGKAEVMISVFVDDDFNRKPV